MSCLQDYMKGMAPGYRCELLLVQLSTHTLHSTTFGVVCLQQQIGRTKYYGDRSFTIYAPRLRNRLPTAIRLADRYENFKTHLKNHLFKEHYLSSTC